MQPNPSIFFKVFLELDVKSMIPFLSFDQRSIKHILDDKWSHLIDKDFPLFYMNEDGKNAIDIALENNQLRSVEMMIDYIIRHQNSYKYSNLFYKSFVEMINKNIPVLKLLKSDIF